MSFQKFTIITTAFILLTFTGCGNSSNTPVNTINSTNNTVNNNGNNNGNASPTVKKPESETLNNAPTLAPVVQAYYDALKKKDDAAVKKTMSQDFIKSVEADRKAEKMASLTAELASNDIIPDKPMEVRNEKIEGNKGSAELRGGTYINWLKFNFVKEEDGWKLTNQYDDVPPTTGAAKTANTANTGKAK